MSSSPSSDRRVLGEIIKIKSVTADAISWQIPDFPVETKKYLPVIFTYEKENGEESYPLPGVVNANQSQLIGCTMPVILDVTKSCDIVLETKEVTVLWQFTIVTKDALRSLLDPAEQDAEDDYESDLCDSDDESVSGEELEYDLGSADEEGTHTVPFKVMGTCYDTERQSVLKQAYRQCQADISVPCLILTEDSNKFDSNAVCVQIELDNVWQKIGYIQRELCPYVRKEIETLLEVNLCSVNFRLFKPLGYYAKISLTKTGTWDQFVTRKSLGVV